MIKKITIIMFILLTYILLTACKPWTVVKIEKDKEKNNGNKIQIFFDDSNFDAEKYVDSLWDKDVIPYVEKKAIDLIKVLDEINNYDIDEVGEKYGIRRGDVSNPWNFIVKGEGKVFKANTDLLNRTLEIDIPPYDNKADIIMQIGPVINGTSIRDSLEFISFDKFVNQLQLADVADAFNTKVYNDILSKYVFVNCEKKAVKFIGAFTYDGQQPVIITPIEFKMD